MVGVTQVWSILFLFLRTQVSIDNNGGMAFVHVGAGGMHLKECVHMFLFVRVCLFARGVGATIELRSRGRWIDELQFMVLAHDNDNIKELVPNTT